MKMGSHIDLGTNALYDDTGMAVAYARESKKGWYWYSNNGSRNGRKRLDGPEKALRAAARTLGFTVHMVRWFSFPFQTSSDRYYATKHMVLLEAAREEELKGGK